jgi:hypothetical protein
MKCKCGTLSITNYAGGKSFEYCKTCKDEVRVDQANQTDASVGLEEDDDQIYRIPLDPSPISSIGLAVAPTNYKHIYKNWTYKWNK